MLIELWRNATVREGFEQGRTLKEISEETGLSQAEVLQRKIELHLFSVAPGSPGGLSRREQRALS
jgi:hypothetical protein